MKKIVIDPNNIDHSLVEEAARTISSGGIVALPTETVYGLGGCTDRKDVVDKLYEIKKRPRHKPFSFAMDSIDKAVSSYFATLPPFGYRIIEKFWPGPLTVIYYTPQGKNIGLRVPSHIITSKILRQLNTAVYLPSANISGEREALSASEVEAVFDDKIDLIVDGGRCTGTKSSTVLDLTFKPFKILRKGVIPEEGIVRAFIKKRILFVCTGNSCRSPMAQLLLEKYLKQGRPYFSDKYEIISRGISALNGASATMPVVGILKKEEAIDANSFAAQRLDKYTVLSSDLIFTMEDAQSRHILRFEPTAEGRVFNLKKFLPSELEKDIPDPIGRDESVYYEVYSIIRQAILELKEWL